MTRREHPGKTVHTRHAHATYRRLLRAGPRVIPDLVGSNPLEVVAWEPWMQNAACLDVDPELFYPAPGDKAAGGAAKRICGRCSVKDDCLAYARKQHDHWGIWGGLSGKQRSRRTA